MVHNDYLPNITVDPQTYEVRVDGKAQDPTTYILPETIRD